MPEALEKNGFMLLDESIDRDLISTWSASLDEALDQSQEGTLTSRGKIYGSRNILETWPIASEIPKLPMLRRFILHVLGDEAGLVRTLFFDKPPGRSWSLPWHRDLTIAVRKHQSATGEYRCPTTKAGLPHVEAPRWLLENMLTLRVHLDPMTQDNGPLVVIAGSHRTSEKHSTAPTDTEITTIKCDSGGVLAMRPLLSHSSLHATEENTSRRRILHFEFAGVPKLTEGYEWNRFEPTG